MLFPFLVLADSITVIGEYHKEIWFYPKRSKSLKYTLTKSKTPIRVSGRERGRDDGRIPGEKIIWSYDQCGPYNLGRKNACHLLYFILMSEGRWFLMPWEVLGSSPWHTRGCWQWLEPIPETCCLNEGTNCWALHLTLEMSVCRQPGKPRVVIWTKCHCLEIFFLWMCSFYDDKSQACAENNNTKCLTAFLIIVWHSVCLIIVSITHTSKLLESALVPVRECTCCPLPLLSLLLLVDYGLRIIHL